MLKELTLPQKILLLVFVVSLLIGGVVKLILANRNTAPIKIESRTGSDYAGSSTNHSIPVHNSSDFIFVHLSGAVKKPGVYKLKPNTRLFEAIEKAGGLSSNAFTDDLNLAVSLKDGDKFTILTTEQHLAAEKNYICPVKPQGTNQNTNSNSSQTSSSNVSNRFIPSNNSAGSNLININTAADVELQNIPGVGPATAKKIIEYRSQNGPFREIEEIKLVKGIGEVKFNKMKDFITVK